VKVSVTRLKKPLLLQLSQVNIRSLSFPYCLAIPLLWCLTSCRTQSVYDAIWKKLKKIAKHMQIEWKMKQCMTDFERAMINSFQEAVSGNKV
jgi:hypothetical protein